MDTIRTLCEGQNAETRRRILAAYWIGAAEGFKARVPPEGIRPQAD